MLDKTNLDECKTTAKLLLNNIEIVDTGFMGIVSHPFYSESFVLDIETNSICNILEDKDSLNKINKQIEKLIDMASNYAEILMLITKPYRLLYFSLTECYLDEMDYNINLIDCFTADECANCNVNVSKADLVKIFKQTNPELIMSKDDYIKYLELPDNITVYRGVTEHNSFNVKALSWTLNIEKAKWFANRFNQNDGKVYQANISKSDIFAYFNGRGEDEIILNYLKLKNIECILEL